MTTHLPVAQVVVPLVAAPLCVAIRQRRLAQALALAVSWITFGISVALLMATLEAGTLRYAMGGWPIPWGIEYRVDALNAFVALFVSGIGAITLTYAPATLRREIPEDRQYLFHAAYLLCLCGLLGIAVTGDLFNLFVFLEISSLSTYALIALGSDRRALTAAFRYLILGTIGATFILIGIGLLYQITGTLNMRDMATRLAELPDLNSLRSALAFLTVGICIKMALYPLHLWLPDAYTYAPSAVSVFLAATATKVSVYVLLRFVFTVFGPGLAFESSRLDAVLLPVSILAIFVASTIAIFQTDVKRLLAYSSIAQVGYMVLGISLATTTGLTAGIVHLFNHALMKGGMFMALGAVALRLGSTRLEDLSGLGRRMPLTMLAWLVGGLGLIGVPLTVGFVSKWYLVQGALERNLWPLASLTLISSLLAVVYVWRVVEIAYFRKQKAGSTTPGEAPLGMLIPMWVLIGATLFFGIHTKLSVGLARLAAQTLLGESG